MAMIKAEGISLVFPLLGGDGRAVTGVATENGKSNNVGGQIVVTRGRARGVQALSNLSLQLRDGDRLGITGHNGAGKSTLLRVLGGIYPPTTGTIAIKGKVSSMFSLSLGVNKEATGYENIRIKGLMYGLSNKQIKALVPEVAEFSELGDYLGLPVKTYSSGMVMRLLFSTATALKPEILLLDEWVSSGDRSFKQKVDEKMETFLSETPIVIIASHNKERIAAWSNKSLHLAKGIAEEVTGLSPVPS